MDFDFKVTNVEHVVINGKNFTLFSLWLVDGQYATLKGKHTISGHYRQHATILRRYQEKIRSDQHTMA